MKSKSRFSASPETSIFMLSCWDGGTWAASCGAGSWESALCSAPFGALTQSVVSTEVDQFTKETKSSLFHFLRQMALNWAPECGSQPRCYCTSYHNTWGHAGDGRVWADRIFWKVAATQKLFNFLFWNISLHFPACLHRNAQWAVLR